MDSDRAKMIINSKKNTDVLYQGEPVWLDSIKDNNMVEVTDMNSHEKSEVPAYKLVEVNPVNK